MNRAAIRLGRSLGPIAICAICTAIAIGESPARGEGTTDGDSVENGAAVEESSSPDRTGLELRLAGTVGVLTNLADRVEESPDYQTSALAGIGLKSEPSIGFNAEVGWRFHPNFSISAHVEHLAELDVSLKDGGRASAEAGNAVLSGESWALTSDARIYLRTGTVQPFLVLGAGWMWADTDDEPILRTGTGTDPILRPIPTGIGTRNGFVARSGGGLDVYLGESFFLTAQATYMVPVGRIRDFDYVSIAWGLGYLF